MQILSPDEIRKAEDNENGKGLTYEEMMENAGTGCAGHILSHYPDKQNIVILCGKGKNGGDGFVIARKLFEASKSVSVITVFNSHSDELSEKNKKKIDGCVNIFDGSTVSRKTLSLIEDADLIIEAVFGIGFRGEMPENIKRLFAAANKSNAVRIAIDIPGGLSENAVNADDCFTADETLSMLCFKKEHIYKPFSDKCGLVTVIPIGFDCPESKLNSACITEIKNILPHRPFDSNKGTFGKALIISGSYKMPGAAIIAAKAALSTGAGLTALAFPDRIYNTVTSHLTECVFRPLRSDSDGCLSAEHELYDDIKSDEYSAIAIGPGLSVCSGAEKQLRSLLLNYKGKLIIDADGINIISRNINLLKESEAKIIMTPHPGEMSRLTGLSVKEINSRREVVAEEFAKQYNVTLLLKGANTVIASPDGRLYINPTGCCALSRGGSGDLLTGIIVSLAAQGLSCKDAAAAGAFIHGLAGETAQSLFTSYCATVERIYDCIPKALSEILSGQ